MASSYGYAGILGGQPAIVLTLFITSDAMDAYFVCMDAATMPAPTAAEVADLVESRWIEFGVDDNAVEALRARLDSGDSVPRLVRIAAGAKPTHGSDGAIEHVIPQEDLVRWNELQAALKAADVDALQAALTELASVGRVLRAVHQGDTLARRTPGTEGEPGSDIRGEELKATDGVDVELSAGANVDIDKNGLEMHATCCGWLAVYGSDQVSVVSPVWMAADRLRICLLHMSGVGVPCLPTLEELTELVAGDGRFGGLDLANWPDLRQQLEAGERQGDIIPLAEGVEPQAGVDGRFEWAVEVGGRAGRILEDGSIDLRDRRLIAVVQPGDLLGRLYPVSPGAPGRNALGVEIPAPDLVEYEVVPDSRVEARGEDDDVVAYYARVEGGVSSTEEERRKRGKLTKRLRLGLYAVSEIEGDVDYTTGHIDFSGDVIIKGSVKPLFRVRATGSVTIEGSVEPGAEIHAGHDIVLSGGAIGSGTRLQAGGSVQVKFLQQAIVQAGADVEVASYLFEASVRAVGSIVVVGKGDGGGRAIVGGLIWAGGNIETPSLGSPSNPRMRIVVGISPVGVAEAESLRGKLRTCEERQSAILEHLGVPQLDAGRLGRLVKKAQPDKRPEVLERLREIVEYGLLRRELRDRLEELASTQRERSRGASLSVSGPIFAGGELRLGEEVTRIEQDTAKLRYHLVEDDDGRWSIQADGI